MSPDTQNSSEIPSMAKANWDSGHIYLRLAHRNDAKTLFLWPPCYILAINIFLFAYGHKITDQNVAEGCEKQFFSIIPMTEP